MDGMLRDILIALAGVVVAGYYSGIEMAAYSMNRARLRLRRLKGDPKAAYLGKLIQDRPGGFIGMTLVAHNAAIYAATLAVTHMYARVNPHWADLLATLSLTPVLFLFSEIIPKTVMGLHADAFIYRTSWALRATHWGLRWVAAAIVGLQNALIRRPEEEKPEAVFEFNRARIRHYLHTSSSRGELGAVHGAIIENAIAVGHRTVQEVALPLSRVVSISPQTTWDQLQGLVRRSTYRRLPVVDGSGAVLGAVNVLEALLAGPERFDLPALIHPVPAISQNRPVFDALQELRRGKTHLGAVVDDKGKVAGIVTVKDLVEVIVGKLRSW